MSDSGAKRGRGRPPGSFKKKKDALDNAQQKLTSLTRSLPNVATAYTEEDSDVESFSEALTENLDSAIERIFTELNKIRNEFKKAIDRHTKEIESLKLENTELKDMYETLQLKIVDLETSRDKQAEEINKNERFSRRNNLRIVGIKYANDENCLDIAREVFRKAGVADCRIERAHRVGRAVNGRDRHILVKLSFYQDKVTVLRNKRHALQNESYYVVEDLTKVDLAEKRKWSKKAAELYQQGTRLHFSAGRWRSSNGKPHIFTV
ncbi:hypothetical protein HOLleu_07378 [Holothuria leucospilota]|uniref:Uncharacterized protein n=1 Tax=Holothuria leucospilota TaxID=206669 RepID=A0A9Q1HGZ6_HOLLE|nr:hypothetical protein HOLleu_07378 [Holothuria leucospilota]